MNKHHPQLHAEVEAFLAKTGMGQSYFGKAAIGNSEFVKRLRNHGRVWPETEMRVRAYILANSHHAGTHGSAHANNQGAPAGLSPEGGAE